jgi:hypothetical protein
VVRGVSAKRTVQYPKWNVGMSLWNVPFRMRTVATWLRTVPGLKWTIGYQEWTVPTPVGIAVT